MTPEQLILLELLADINKFGYKCKKLNVPPEMYKLLDKLRSTTAKWGIENIVKGESDDTK